MHFVVSAAPPGLAARGQDDLTGIKSRANPNGIFTNRRHTQAVDGNLAEQFCALKRAFFSGYRGSAHIQEAVPDSLEGLHGFAASNPIYYNSYPAAIGQTPCTVYEGDINQYWINSLKNANSAQPFYPTWMISAYALALAAKESNSQIIDVGSGDGRIAICGRMLGLDACSIEIDQSLAELQQDLARNMGVRLDVQCTDASLFDYSSLGFDDAMVFTGGLPQMGDILAEAVVMGLNDAGVGGRLVLAGSRPRPGQGTPSRWYGWGPLLDRFGLRVDWEMSLPTVWTFDQPLDTPYVCVSRA